MLKILLEKDYYRIIPESDYMSRQRYVLFVLLSIIAVCTGVILFSILNFVYHLPGHLVYLMPGLSIAAIINYFAFQVHKKRLFAYSFVIGLALLIIHNFIYFTGGIYAPGNFYLLVLAIITFMLLGKKAGWIFLAIAGAHLVWAYYATLHTHLITNFHDGKPGNMEGDLLMSTLVCITIISSLCISLNKSTQVILQAMSETNLNLHRSMDELEITNKNLENTNKELDKFAYVVSHDLKAPLRAIGSLSSWIEEEMQENNVQAASEHLEILKGRVSRMENLINGILQYSRLNKDKAIIEYISIHKILNECIEMVSAPERFRFIIPENLPSIYTERIKLEQILINLISNAVKYNDKADGCVEFSYQDRGSFMQFSVKDNGPGIEAQYHEKIFVIFQTLQARDTFESTGVGLAIVKKIIDEKGGSIYVESKLGEGAEFIFLLPKEDIEQSEVQKPYPIRMAS